MYTIIQQSHNWKENKTGILSTLKRAGNSPWNWPHPVHVCLSVSLFDRQRLYYIVDDRIHYSDVIIGTIPSQISSLKIVYSTASSDVDQRQHQSSASLAFVGGNHRSQVNSPHKGPVTRKIFPFDHVIMQNGLQTGTPWEDSSHFIDIV